ncbi:MAG: hypothetical protein COB04_00035 [Gammaproteobacteria bacterium]|nr:MAG: hypothetical protein COB04_00035 [Gammaproteobacteria bacterium]
MNVLILGISKTGTTAISKAIHVALGHRFQRLNFEPTTFGIEGGKTEAWHIKKCKQNDVVTKCLVFPSQSLGTWDRVMNVARHYSHVVWIDRDPRDRLISNNFYSWFYGHIKDGSRSEKTNWEDKFLKTLAKVEAIEENPGCIPYIDTCDEWWESMGKLHFLQQQFNLYYSISLQRKHMQGWHRINYRDFVDGNVSGLNHYLGLEINHNVKVKLKRVARTKGYGGWRDWFNDEDVRFLKPLYYHYLAEIGEDPDDWTLLHPDSIDPTIGSAYMKKVHYRFSIAS